MPFDQSSSLFFIGPLDDDASVDGLCWFCHRVWPELNRRLPEAQFAITGWNRADRVRDLSGIPGGIVVDNTFDVRAHIHRATIAAFPYRQACAVQDEVLHALTMRKAVIATPVVLDSLQMQPGVHLRAVNTVSDWIAVSYHLMMHPEVCAELGVAGRAYVERYHPGQLQFQSFAIPAPAATEPKIVPPPKHTQQPKTARSTKDP